VDTLEESDDGSIIEDEWETQLNELKSDSPIELKSAREPIVSKQVRDAMLDYLNITATAVKLHFPDMSKNVSTKELTAFVENSPFHLYHDLMMSYMRTQWQKSSVNVKRKKQNRVLQIFQRREIGNIEVRPPLHSNEHVLRSKVQSQKKRSQCSRSRKSFIYVFRGKPSSDKSKQKRTEEEDDRERLLTEDEKKSCESLNHDIAASIYIRSHTYKV